MRKVFALAAAGALCFSVACDGDDHTQDASTTPPMDGGTGGGMDASAPRDGGMNGEDAGTRTLYDRLGGRTGIEAVIGDFVGRVGGDAKINGYFQNRSVDGQRLLTCLVKQVSAVTGGPATYPARGEPADADGCRNMVEAHAGLGISAADYNDLAGHLVAALTAAGVAQDDIGTITAALTEQTFVADIVEDATNDGTIYQRVGRKPGIQAVIGDFVGRVVADPKINGYFLNSSVDGARLGTCLVRQVCAATGGPCKYGQGVEAELGGVPCKDMTTVHMGLGISTNDFNDLVGHMADALTAAQVAQTDLMAIAGVLTSTALKTAIIEDPMNDQTVYQRVRRKPAIQTVVNDFAGRVLGDASINGFFSTSTTAVARLGTCLVRQVCSVGGPCKYGEGVEAELGGTPCRDMRATHMGVTSPRGGGAGSRGITTADFSTLVQHLVDAMNAASIPANDQMVYLNALGPMCTDIVTDANNCP